MTVTARTRGQRWHRVVMTGVLTLLIAVVAAAAAVGVVVHRGGSPAGIATDVERRIGMIPPGWVKDMAMDALGPSLSMVSGTSAALPAPPPAVIGMNAPAVHFAASTVPFANLVMGSDWTDTRWAELSDRFQDSAGGIRALPADGTALRFLSIPPIWPEGFEVRCTFAGSGTLTVAGAARQTGSWASMLRFHVVNLHGKASPP